MDDFVFCGKLFVSLYSFQKPFILDVAHFFRYIFHVSSIAF